MLNKESHTWMKKYLEIMQGINYALFCVLILVLPYPWRIANYVIIAWLIAWALEFRWLIGVRQNWQSHTWRERLPFFMPLLLLAWEALSLFWSIDRAATSQLIERHILLAVIPLVASFGLNRHYRTDRLLALWVKAAVISVPVYLFVSLMVINGWQYYYDTHHFGPINWAPAAFTNLTGQVKHHIFYAMVLILAFCAFPYIYRTHTTMHFALSTMHFRYPRWARIATLSVAAVVLLAGIVFSNARASWLSMAVLPVAWIVLHLRGLRRVAMLGATALIAVLIAAALYRFVPRFDQIASDPRIIEWRTFLAHHDDYTFLGTGAGTAEQVMVGYYQQDGGDFTMGIAERYGTHNQFFNARLTLGPLAVVILLAMFLAIVVGFWHSARWWAVALSLTYLVTMLMDDLMERLDPIMTLITALTLCLVISTSPKNNPS